MLPTPSRTQASKAGRYVSARSLRKKRVWVQSRGREEGGRGARAAPQGREGRTVTRAGAVRLGSNSLAQSGTCDEHD